MFEFKTDKSIFCMTNNYQRTFPTTSKKQNTTDLIVLYEYNIEHIDGIRKLTINFVSEYADIIPDWIKSQYDSEVIKSFNSKLVGKLNLLTTQLDNNILENCLRLKELIKKDDFFGINVLRYSEEINQTSAYFQILDFREYENEELVYRKGGVMNNNDTATKISAYRHMLEWDQINKIVKMTELDIGSGQNDYSRKSKIVFELIYGGGLKFVSPKSPPKKEIKENWINSISKIIDDPQILNKVNSLISTFC
ncbi:hypothetical protein KQ941_01840 [Paenibacillus xylanexedens]|uniref:hypothetical protein n=1 Tax=Paenibacillus xylanexedens TaxID=528191 RepID=UPI001F1DF7B3|nr:hypothetical protein [Paenibacillus xylanexedens]MCF7753167.1 hypothetical protein [Paenibacillus xylanexedens]